MINQSNQSLPVGVRSDQSEEKLLYRNSWHDRVWTLDIDNGSQWSEKLPGTQMEPGNIYISNYIKLGKYIFSKL